jgi:LacI family transcriptional regulator
MSLNVRKIAKLAGCAPSTVSRVLSGNYGNVRVGNTLREKIISICAENDYEPDVHASRLFSRQTGIIGLLTPGGSVSLSDENLSRFSNAVYKQLNNSGYRVLLLVQDEAFIEKKQYLSVFRRREVDALIIWGIYGNHQWLDELAANKKSFILASNRVVPFPSVTCNDQVGIQAMVNQCLQRGARRFFYVGGTLVDIGIRREEAFRCAVGVNDYRVTSGDFTLQAGVQIVGDILSWRPDAVICANDKTAIGVISELSRKGVRIPEDIMVTGADNIELSEYIHPSLTTFDQMSDACGTACAEMILSHIRENTEISSCIIPPVIHLRGSA